MKKIISLLIVIVMAISTYGGFTAYAGSLDFVPGEVIIQFKEQYTGESIAALYPELDIAEEKDSTKRLYEAWIALGMIPKEDLETDKDKFGWDYLITLVDKSKKAVLNAIKTIESNPCVDYAQPNFIYSYDGYGTGGLVATPIVSYVEGDNGSSVIVTMTCETEGAVIYYTTNGKFPTFSGTEYSGPVEFSSATTIKVIAYKESMQDSEMVMVTFTVEPPARGTYFPGDISGNGYLDFGDAGLLLNHVTEIYELTDPIMLKNADINNDGTLGFDDVGIMLLRLGLVAK